MQDAAALVTAQLLSFALQLQGLSKVTCIILVETTEVPPAACAAAAATVKLAVSRMFFALQSTSMNTWSPS